MNRRTSPAVMLLFLLASSCRNRDVAPGSDTVGPDGSAGGNAGVAAGGGAGGGSTAGGSGGASGRPDAGEDAFTLPPFPDMGTVPVDGGCQPEGEQRYTPAPDGVASTTEEFAAQAFNSNPPSSGKHCAQAGGYGAYDKDPLPRCNYLANLALGGIVLAYNCPAGCNDILGQLQVVFRDVAKDPDCPSLRILITPDPALDVKVAAAAWGATWRSNCLDQTSRASLVKFVKDHLGSAGSAPGKSPPVCN